MTAATSMRRSLPVKDNSVRNACSTRRKGPPLQRESSSHSTQTCIKSTLRRRKGKKKARGYSQTPHSQTVVLAGARRNRASGGVEQRATRGRSIAPAKANRRMDFRYTSPSAIGCARERLCPVSQTRNDFGLHICCGSKPAMLSPSGTFPLSPQDRTSAG